MTAADDIHRNGTRPVKEDIDAATTPEVGKPVPGEPGPGPGKPVPGEPMLGEDVRIEATGEPRVDDALRRLGELGDLPVSEHPPVFERVHASLVDVLGELRSGVGDDAGRRVDRQQFDRHQVDRQHVDPQD